MNARFVTVCLAVLASCGAPPGTPDAGMDSGDLLVDSGSSLDASVETGVDAGAPDAAVPVDPFADRVVSFDAGFGAGFGQDRFPQVVLGPPQGGGASAGSLDVLSLGRQGIIILEFTDIVAIDGPGPDFTVFENVFSGFRELGGVSASDDGVNWHAFTCASTDVDAGFPGCAGVNPTFSSPENTIAATDPLVSGGDSFDLADVGLSSARFVRIIDTGTNRFYGPPGGGFDLDAVAVVNGLLIDGGTP